jgi:hypothetical protein
MSRILNRQRQLAEQGRLRLGYTLTSQKGKTYPKASHTWVITSHSKEHVEAAAALWGGQVEEWQPQGNGAKQWRVITGAAAIDAILPPGDPLSQAYEMWNRGGCVRRCDGVTEQLSGSPCACFAEFGEEWFEQKQGMVCDSKSRLKVLLPDMPGLGSWRVETGSYYATDEIAGMVDVIRGAVGDSVMVPVRLRIEPRTRVAGGETKQFVVPVLELRDVTAGALLAGQYSGLASIEQGRSQQAAIEAAPRLDYVQLSGMAESLDEVRNLWRHAQDAGLLTEELKQVLTAAGQRLSAPVTPAGQDADVDPDAAWQELLAAAGRLGWSQSVLAESFVEWSRGVALEDAEPRSWAEFTVEMNGGAAA